MNTSDADADADSDPATLRSRATDRLTGNTAAPRVRADPSAALGVLYELASSPSTAPSALALLHELQVHQVEVDMQSEELRRSRAETETLLDRQVQFSSTTMRPLATSRWIPKRRCAK